MLFDSISHQAHCSINPLERICLDWQRYKYILNLWQKTAYCGRWKQCTYIYPGNLLPFVLQLPPYTHRYEVSHSHVLGAIRIESSQLKGWKTGWFLHSCSSLHFALEMILKQHKSHNLVQIKKLGPNDHHDTAVEHGISFSELKTCNVMNWPGGSAVSLLYWLQHWLMLYTLGLCIVIVHWCTNNYRLIIIFTFGIRAICCFQRFIAYLTVFVDFWLLLHNWKRKRLYLLLQRCECGLDILIFKISWCPT